MLLIEWWAYEILIIFSGWLGVTELATSIVLLNIHNTLYSFSLGSQYSAVCLIGNSIGEKSYSKTRIYIFSIYAIMIFLACFYIILMQIFYQDILEIFTQDPKILGWFESVLIYFTF
mmetsp:Transcript_19698/g.22019  ORF Transcript_19698/g.22019 Transcript_19698/m.22019 type:complete len:117 (+) Transcript_19698:230-580(+)